MTSADTGQTTKVAAITAAATTACKSSCLKTPSCKRKANKPDENLKPKVSIDGDNNCDGIWRMSFVELYI